MGMKILETQRLVLRRLEASDVTALLGIFSDPEAICHYPATKTRSEAEDWVRWTLEGYRRHGFGLWAAVLRDSNEFAGQCGLGVQEVDGELESELGHLFLRRLWGRGLATVAARACGDYAFDHHLGHARLVSLIDPANVAPRRVAGKISMSLEQQTQEWGNSVCVTPSATRRPDGDAESRNRI